VREGRRKEFVAFGWAPEAVPDPQALETFTRSKLDWQERQREPHASLLDWYRRLVQLRRQLPALTDGCMERVRVRFDADVGWLLMERGPVTVGCNFATQPQHVPLRPGCPRHLLLASDPGIRVCAERLELPPDTVAILGPVDSDY
jgi:maltooligosyltrehalose trehalohydrolase